MCPVLLLGATLVGVVPLSMIVMLGCYALVWLYLNRTPAGRATVAIGGNEETVRLAGVDVQRTVVVAYMLSGALSALSGAILVLLRSPGTSSWTSARRSAWCGRFWT